MRALLPIIVLVIIACGEAAAQQTRFVTDTLFSIVGGPFRVERGQLSPYGPGGIVAITRLNKAGEPYTTLYQDPTDHELAHEAGHVLDYRQLAPHVLAEVDFGRERYNNKRSWVGSSREEYVAEAFAHAVLSMRVGFRDSTQVERRFPGTISVIRWLLMRAVLR